MYAVAGPAFWQPLASGYKALLNSILRTDFKMADDRDSLLREVDEELRRDQLQRLWSQYNGVIIGAVAAIVLGVLGYQIVHGRRIAAAEAAGAQYQAAVDFIDNKKNDEAEKVLTSLAGGGSSGYAALARLQLAGAQLKAGKTADALGSFEALGKDGSADDLLKSFAQLQAASLRMADADFTEIQNRLKPLAEDGGAFKISAREMLGFAAYKAGNLVEARKYFEPLLIDPNASRQIQERIKVVMTRIAAAEIEKLGAPAPVNGAPTAAPAASEMKSEMKPGEKKDEITDAAPAQPATATAPAAQEPKADEKSSTDKMPDTKSGVSAQPESAPSADKK